MSSNVGKFPIGVSRKAHARKPRASLQTTTRARQARVLTGERWEEIIACFEPEQQQAFMADVWKLLNRHFRKL
jgi:hypothetical protein